MKRLAHLALAGLLLGGLTATAPVAATAATPPAGSYVPLATAQRLLDTRSGSGPLTAGDTTTVDVASGLGIAPGQVAAVAVTTTVAGAAQAGWLSVAPQATAATSTINFPTGWVGANTTIVPVNTDGTITVRIGSGQTDVTVDVVGWFTTAATPPAGTALSQVDVTDPYRVYDSRPAKKPLVAGTSQDFPVDLGYDTTGVTITSVLAQITVADATGSGWVTAWSGLGTKPLTSNLNYAPGENASTLALIPVRKDPTTGKYKFMLSAGGSGSTHIIIDSVGATGPFAAPVPGATYRRIDLRRVLDTRHNVGVGSVTDQIKPSTARVVPGVTPYVTANTAALVGNATLLAPPTGAITSKNAWSLFWSGGLGDKASTLNAPLGQVRATGAFVVPSLGKTMSVFNGVTSASVIKPATGSIDALYDLSGTFEYPAGVTAATKHRSKAWSLASPNTAG